MKSKSGRLRVAVKPDLLRWARERAGLTVDALEERFPKYEQWETGEVQPTLKQLERLAKRLYVPIGLLFLDKPPDEPLPIPDFRTMPGGARRPSPNLLDTIYLCQQRQEWYREYLKVLGEGPLPYVGSAALESDPIEVAADIRKHLQFDIKERSQIPNWTEALRRFIAQAEAAGILVMSSGIVGSNSHRKLDPQEFRGFALVDDQVPVIFINAADTKAAQMFTLAHEIAHVWLGAGGVSDAQLVAFPDSNVEQWCNQVAAELLVPLEAFRRMYRSDEPLRTELDRLARYFKVSTLVVLRRMYEVGKLSWEAFWRAYDDELTYLQKFARGGEGGGNFYYTLRSRVSGPFAEAVVISTLEGQTLFRDAYQLLGIRTPETFHKFAERLGVY